MSHQDWRAVLTPCLWEVVPGVENAEVAGSHIQGKHRQTQVEFLSSRQINSCQDGLQWLGLLSQNIRHPGRKCHHGGEVGGKTRLDLLMQMRRSEARVSVS